MQWNRGHSKSKGVNASSLVSTPLWLITAGLSPPASCILAHRPDPNRGLQQSNENCASNCPAGDPGLAKKGPFHSPPFWLTRWLYKSLNKFTCVTQGLLPFLPAAKRAQLLIFGCDPSEENCWIFFNLLNWQVPLISHLPQFSNC